MKERGDRLKCAIIQEHPSAAKKGSQPRLAALDSPFQGKGLAWTLPPSYGRRCPEGAEVGWGKRNEKRSGEIDSNMPFTRVPYPPLRGPPSPMWKAAIRGCRFSRIAKANTGYVEKKNNNGQSLPRVGKVASGASRIGFWRYEKERERSSQVRCLRKHPIHRCAVPLPLEGKVASKASRIGY